MLFCFKIIISAKVSASTKIHHHEKVHPPKNISTQKRIHKKGPSSNWASSKRHLHQKAPAAKSTTTKKRLHQKNAFTKKAPPTYTYQYWNILFFVQMKHVPKYLHYRKYFTNMHNKYAVIVMWLNINHFLDFIISLSILYKTVNI